MSKSLTALLAALLVCGLSLASGPAFADPADGASTSADQAGDVHDDRPDDADAVGGDQSTETTSISAGARAWAGANGFDLSAFEDYAAPAAHTPTADDIAAFGAWMSGGSNPRNQVMSQITSAAGESVANELWNYCNTIWKRWMNAADVGSVVSQTSGLKNVGATQEGMFAGYFGSLIGGAGGGQSGYGNAATLVKDGFVVSSDGVTYRLHNMIDGTIAYETAAPESVSVSEDEFPAGLTDFTDFLPLETQEATDEAVALLRQYAAEGSFADPSGVDRDVYQAAAQYVNDEFGEYYGQCPGPTAVKGITALGLALDAVTEDTVGSSVGEKEFTASFFGVTSAAASLWRLGFLPSFDGTTYRLHSGKSGAVVYEIAAADLPTSEGTSTAAGTGAVSAPALVAIVVSAVAALAVGGAAWLILRRKGRSGQGRG
ncbi:MAG: hypothetical protein LBJ44_10670 [Propionibacteriaceae bacterium]|jgi:hypothetical protein|nr:hypothetical protein [Propionibacteriaceae bacterium]